MSWERYDDQIPFVDADNEEDTNCDGSISSNNTMGSVLQHTSDEEEEVDSHASYSNKWSSAETNNVDDQHSLNNVLDSVSSRPASRSAESEYLLSETSTLPLPPRFPDEQIRIPRPHELNLSAEKRRVKYTISAAYSAASEELRDVAGYESIYSAGSSCPSTSVTACSSPTVAHHYISTLRVSSARGSATPEREKAPSLKLQSALQTRYRKWIDTPWPIPWCPDFNPHVSQMVFGLALDLAWEKATHRSGSSLRTVSPHGIFADERRMTSSKILKGQRILVVGESGYGKTTLCLRLLWDWCQSDGYMNNFKLVFFVPLREVHLHKNLFFCSKDEVENPASLITECESETLFIIDGLEEVTELPQDVVSILEGKLYPSSTVVATSRPCGSAGVSSACFDKRVVVRGFELTHIESLVNHYFGYGTEGAEKLLLTLQHNNRLLKLASSPLMCILLCLVYEESQGKMPLQSLADFFGALLSFLLRKSLQTSLGITTQQRRILLDFGRLALNAMKSNKFLFSAAEIKAGCQTNELCSWGFLLRCRSFTKSAKNEWYQPVHTSVCEYLAALYIASISHYANILQREIHSLPLDLEPCLANSAGIERNSLHLLFQLCSILGKKAHLFFSIIAPFEFPAKTLLSFLQTAGSYEGNVSAICRLLSGHAQLSTAASELASWAVLLENANCQLFSLHIVAEGGDVGRFLESLEKNTSVSSIKISAVVGEEQADLFSMAELIVKATAKPKLQSLEISISCVEEFSSPSVLQPLVSAFCSAVPASAMSKVVLDVDLTTQQVIEICNCLSQSTVRTFHLLHTRYETQGLQRLTSLMATLDGLDLSGSSGRFDDARDLKSPSKESGIGLGNSEISIMVTEFKDTPNAAALEESAASLSSSSTSTPVSSNRASVYLPQSEPPASSRNEFLSLPRRTRGSRNYSSLTRGVTPSSVLSRNDEKRRSDSMLFQKVLLPLPACDRSSHALTGLHSIFEGLRSSLCRLSHLNLSKCGLNVSDSMCLGESLRKNATLVSLRLEGLGGVREALPVILALADNKALQLLDVSSAHIVINDSAFQLICRALSRNSTLRSLRLCSWTFCIEDEGSGKCLCDMLETSRMAEIALTNSKIKLALDGKMGPLSSALIGPVVMDNFLELLLKDNFHLNVMKSDSLSFLRLDNCLVELSEKVTLKGPHLLPFVIGFQRLSELNLSLNGAQLEPIRDKAAVLFFSTLSRFCFQLRSLVLDHWHFQWTKPDKTLKSVTKSIRGLALSSLSIDTLLVNGENCGYLGIALAQSVVSTLPKLTILNLSGWDLSEDKAAALGKTIRDKYSGQNLQLQLKNVAIRSVRSLLKAAEEGGKISSSFVGGSQQVYQFRKAPKSANFLEKVMCITTWKES